MNICNNYEDPRMERTSEENAKAFSELVAATATAKSAERAEKLLLGSV